MKKTHTGTCFGSFPVFFGPCWPIISPMFASRLENDGMIHLIQMVICCASAISRYNSSTSFFLTLLSHTNPQQAEAAKGGVYLITLEAVRPRIPLTGIAGGDGGGLNWTNWSMASFPFSWLNSQMLVKLPLEIFLSGCIGWFFRDVYIGCFRKSWHRYRQIIIETPRFRVPSTFRGPLNLCVTGLV